MSMPSKLNNSNRWSSSNLVKKTKLKKLNYNHLEEQKQQKFDH